MDQCCTTSDCACQITPTYTPDLGFEPGPDRAKLRPLRLPPRPRERGEFITYQQRLELLQRLLNDPDVPIADRLIGTLILLYAQPLQRILHLRTDSIRTSNNSCELTLHRTPIPIPPAVQHLISGYLTHRAHYLPATDPQPQPHPPPHPHGAAV